MTFEKYRDPRTLADVIRLLDSITRDCLNRSHKVGGIESDKLRRVVEKAEVAREKVKDLSIEMAEYITYSLQHDTVGELPEDP